MKLKKTFLSVGRRSRGNSKMVLFIIGKQLLQKAYFIKITNSIWIFSATINILYEANKNFIRGNPLSFRRLNLL